MTNYMTSNQPKGIKESMGYAYNSLQHGVVSAIDSVIICPIQTYQKTNNTSETLQSVIKGVPIAILKPIGGVTEALSYTLLGCRNQIYPHKRLDEEDLYHV